MVIGEIIFDSNLCDHNPPTSQTDRRHAIARLRFALAKVKKSGFRRTKALISLKRGKIGPRFEVE